MDGSKDKHKRFLQAINLLKNRGVIHKQQDIADKMGIVKTNVSNSVSGRPRYFTDGFLRRFAAAYRDHISEDWLLTGAGRMDIPAADERPHVESLRASAGYMDGMSEPVVDPEFRRLSDLLPAYDFSMLAAGDSMLPEIHSGDILLCRRVLRRLDPADVGRIFVFDTPDGTAVKRLAAATPEGVLTLHSLNPSYADYTADAASLSTLARVVAVLHPV